MKRSFCALAILLVAAAILGLAAGGSVHGQDKTRSHGGDGGDAAGDASGRRVLVISIDGCRPDLLLLADCPNIRGLIASGSYSFWARTTPVGITLPSHTSMMTGVVVEKHGITWNGSDIPEGVDYQHPKRPTLFEVAKAKGYTTAIAAGKLKFTTLDRGESVDWIDVPATPKRDDAATTEAALKIIGDHQPQVMLFHLGHTDTVGHASGWGSAAQRETIEHADRCVGRVIDLLKDKRLYDDTLIIVTADHGGYGKSHSGGDPRGLHIPWIAVGPGVKPNYDLTGHHSLIIHTEDTFATACDFLNLDMPDDTDGRPVKQAFTAAHNAR